MRSEEILTDTHSIKMNQISTKITEFLFFLNLHLFYRTGILRSDFFIDMDLILPPKKNLKPLLLPFPFCKRKFARLEMKVFVQGI